MRRGHTPYQQFGRRLHDIRLRLQESLPEVSGAVELDSDVLARYERGEDRPSEDVLLLLINHFAIKDEEADELWELAGYTSENHNHHEEAANLPTLMMVPMDNRVIYTDTAHVVINNYGVIMNFMQNGANNQPMAVARVGMSLEHAKSVLEVLATTIAQAESVKTPKQLPESSKSLPKNKKQQF
ncbi:helix-turn-helix domain-containing protein [Candidatus Saccharibacteria bacterium]|nr:helix-turn-helix domain-containing protein [Candidatus Saccharibacteria bacterium]